MGVCGVGKSTVARRLAETFGGGFIEGDKFHPEENIRAMSSGQPLTDAMRLGWLDAICGEGERVNGQEGRPAFIACSALKRRYRERLSARLGPICFVHLTGDPELIRERLVARRDHFMPVALLESQLADLEPIMPDESGLAVSIDVANPIEEVVRQSEQFCRRLGLPHGAAGGEIAAPPGHHRNGD